jgi:hypothetical protein
MRWKGSIVGSRLLSSSDDVISDAEKKNEDKSMAATTSTGFSIPASASTLPSARIHSARRRITPQAGHALEILAHAIEYLADESIHERSCASDREGQLEAVQMLMAVNRQIYSECPEVPTFGERCRKLFHLS